MCTAVTLHTLVHVGLRKTLQVLQPETPEGIFLHEIIKGHAEWLKHQVDYGLLKHLFSLLRKTILLR